MSTQQGLRHASFRAISGTEGTYNEDSRAAFETEAPIFETDTYDQAFIVWLQVRLGTLHEDLTELMQAFAEEWGAQDWSQLGSFDPIVVGAADNVVNAGDNVVSAGDNVVNTP